MPGPRPSLIKATRPIGGREELSRRKTGAIERIVPLQHLQDALTIDGIPGNRTDLIEARAEGDQATSGDPAPGRLDGSGIAKSRRLADRSAGIAAEMKRPTVTPGQCGGTTARPPRHPLSVPRIGDHTVGRCLVGSSHGELITTGLPHQYCTGSTEAANRSGIFLSLESSEHRARSIATAELCRDVHFCGKGDSIEWPKALPLGSPLVTLIGSLLRGLDEDLDHSVQLPADPLKKLEVAVDQLTRGAVAIGEPLLRFTDRGVHRR